MTTLNQQITNWKAAAEACHDYYQGMAYTNEIANEFLSEFSPAVEKHIEEYVWKQYGEQIAKGTDALSTSENPVSYCSDNIKKYRNRKGKNQRAYNDGRDCLKRAHYAQLRGTVRGEISLDDIREIYEAFIDWKELGR